MTHLVDGMNRRKHSVELSNCIRDLLCRSLCGFIAALNRFHDILRTQFNFVDNGPNFTNRSLSTTSKAAHFIGNNSKTAALLSSSSRFNRRI
ncbi:Uncharacterised protein [Vibrio cholerae]|uniref:Uncharacterized protein n=1 Tax=Vibrio cholerae TaxID=666 RepID=A0A656AU94_VIBCL|nr:Uncharacterised protein [Vibrio cholerae]CSD37968.1 Uncharacterised protein [Vibrio cholerae]